ncbi:hypothetical protein LSM04_005126 [Trypanosoma melophagium]|uniref:uncharacterized protein n=1 Tax=Trypanosoma melophagium TaxID=715481 RepID=UPI00351A5F50|nr:hypothetical protein LSM04_005126 [Trypanosoma melophagium]
MSFAGKYGSQMARVKATKNYAANNWTPKLSSERDCCRITVQNPQRSYQKFSNKSVLWELGQITPAANIRVTAPTERSEICNKTQGLAINGCRESLPRHLPVT